MPKPQKDGLSKAKNIIWIVAGLMFIFILIFIVWIMISIPSLINDSFNNLLP